MDVEIWEKTDQWKFEKKFKKFWILKVVIDLTQIGISVTYLINVTFNGHGNMRETDQWKFEGKN